VSELTVIAFTKIIEFYLSIQILQTKK